MSCLCWLGTDYPQKTFSVRMPETITHVACVTSKSKNELFKPESLKNRYLGFSTSELKRKHYKSSIIYLKAILVKKHRIREKKSKQFTTSVQGKKKNNYVDI